MSMLRVLRAGIGIAGALVVLFAAAAEAQPANPTPWRMGEFDWGDSKSIVDETVMVTNGFTCHRIGSSCAVATTTIDGELMLLKFAYRNDGLYRIRVATPEVDWSRVPDLERIWKVVADWITRHKGKPKTSTDEFPALAKIPEGSHQVTHRWELPDQEIRLEVGRRGKGFLVAATFLDPTRDAKKAPETAATPKPQSPKPTAQPPKP